MASVNNQSQRINPSSESTRSKIKNTVKGSLHKILSLPDKQPKLRVVFDIAIIALAIIAMISMLLTSGISGPMFFAIVPLMGFMGLGVALLISDTVKNKKVQRIAEKVAAAIVPLIILGSGAAFITAGVLAVPTSAAFLGTPQFILGIVISSLAIVALKNITVPKLLLPKNQTSSTKKNISTIKNAANNNTASTKANTIVNQRKKILLNQERKTLQRKANMRRNKRKYTVPKNVPSK